MAIRKVHYKGERYFGYSGDVFPTTNNGDGDSLTELDTGKQYVFYDGAWHEDLTLIYAISQAIAES